MYIVVYLNNRQNSVLVHFLEVCIQNAYPRLNYKERNKKQLLNTWRLTFSYKKAAFAVKSEEDYVVMVTGLFRSYAKFPGKKDSGFPRTFWLKFQQTVTFLSEDFCVKLREQVCMSANGRFWSEIKRSIAKIVTKKIKIFHDYLPKFNTKNSIWSQFILNAGN